MLLFLLDTWRTLPQMLDRSESIFCKLKTANTVTAYWTVFLVSTVSIKQENVFIKSYIKKKNLTKL